MGNYKGKTHKWKEEILGTYITTLDGKVLQKSVVSILKISLNWCQKA
jgi:hypothetical protein